MLDSFNPHPGTVTTTATLNLRRGRPSTEAPIAERAAPGTDLRVLGLGKGDLVSGNDTWFAGEGDLYFWSGGCSTFQAEPPVAPGTGGGAGGGAGSGAARPAGQPSSAGLPVHRRPDGTIRPLSDAEILRIFDAFPYREGPRTGEVTISSSWADDHIVTVRHPVLAGLGHPAVEMHRKMEPWLVRALDRIQAAGLEGLLKTFDGLWVPRHKGWDPSRGLSSHSWGIAVDFNARWNPYQRDAAPLGAVGNVRALVPHFAAEGFAWGGHFTDPYQDGMHFELARTDI